MKSLLIFIMTAFVLVSCKTNPISGTDSSVQNDSLKTTKNTDETDDYYQPNREKNIDAVYVDAIRTVQLYGSEWVFSPPVIYLTKNNQLTLSFDELSNDMHDFYFTFELCDAQWNTVDLPQQDYLDGFFEDRITDYGYSRNTLTNYIHYSVNFPSEDMKPKLSGNYILKVWTDDNGDRKTVITRRFFVSEQAVGINMDVKKATRIEERDYQHEIDFTINKSGVEIIDPYRNMTVMLQQNGRYDNIISDLKPRLIKGDEFDYNYESGNVFDAVNEFRHFDMKSLTYYTDRIAKIEKKDDGQFHVWLKDDSRRPYLRYISEDDVNGRFLIKNDDGNDTDLESEYVWVHFFLGYDAPVLEGSLYLMGGFTDWNCSDAYKLDYSYKLKGYSDSLLLKQGYYNYHYVLLGTGTAVADETFIEGRHAEADSDYTIYVYYREPGELWDRLLGIQIMKSAKGL